MTLLCIAFVAVSSFGQLSYRERLALRGEINASETIPQKDAEQFADPVTNATVELVSNGGFESNGGAGTSNFQSWTVFNQAGGSGSWYVQTGTTAPPGGSGVTVPDPPGSFAAMTHQYNPGAHYLYQDVFIPTSASGATLSFSLYLNNQAVPSAWHTTTPLDYSGEANQQFRADLIDPSREISTTSVLLSVYRTKAGDALVSGYSTIQKNIPDYLTGRTVRLRFSEVDNQGYLLAGVDKVSITIVQNETAPTATLNAAPEAITVGSGSTLTWTTTNASSVFIDNGIGPVALNGSMAVYPQSTTKYTLTATGSSSVATATRTITVNPAPSQPVLATLQIIPNEISAGGSVTFDWETSGATSAAITVIGPVDLKGSMVVTPAATRTYVLTAVNGTKKTETAATVYVRTVPKPAISVFAATPSSITAGQTVTLNWTSTGGSTAEIDGDAQPVSGSMSVKPTQTRTYTLAVDGAGGRATKTTTITVNSAPPPAVGTPAGKPGKAGATDGKGSEALFNNPAGIGVDRRGYIFVIDGGNHTLRRVSPDGTSETWAGKANVKGFRDGLRGEALFDFSNFKGAMLVREDGSLVVSDASNRIRYVDTNGLVTTCSSVSCARLSVGAMAEDSAHNRYDADTGSNTIHKVTPQGVDSILAGQATPGFRDGPGTTALFRSPRGIAVDKAGNVYVGDTGNNAIRKITPDGTVTTIAGASASSAIGTLGASSARFTFGCCGGQVAVDPVNGTVYVTNPGDSTIKQITTGGEVSTVVGSGAAGSTDGSASQAGFNEPLGLTIKGDGKLIVADTKNHTIRETTPVATATGCVASSTTACALNGRLAVSVRYRAGFDNSAADTDARVRTVAGFGSATSETIFFYFNDPSNIELMVKTLDQGNTNAAGQPTLAVLYGSATPLRVELRVSDTKSGTVKTYVSPFNSMKGGTDFTAILKLLFDPGTPSSTQVIADAPNSAARVQEPEPSNVWAMVVGNRMTFARRPAPEATCTPSATAPCLLGGRFRVGVRYRGGFDNNAADKDAQVKSLTGFGTTSFETAFFYFNDSNNLEMMVKILDQGNTDSAGNPTIAVLFGTATPLRVELTITDTKTGAVRTYTSPFGTMQGATDFAAFWR